jgi:hypothetical protein
VGQHQVLLLLPVLGAGAAAATAAVHLVAARLVWGPVRWVRLGRTESAVQAGDGSGGCACLLLGLGLSTKGERPNARPNNCMGRGPSARFC